MAITKKTASKSATTKSKAPAKKSAATTAKKAPAKKSVATATSKSAPAKKAAAAPKKTAVRKATQSSKGIIAKTKDAVVEAVSTVVGGAVAGAAAAGTKLMEEKTGSVKKSVKKGPAGITKAPAKDKAAAAKN